MTRTRQPGGPYSRQTSRPTESPKPPVPSCPGGFRGSFAPARVFLASLLALVLMGPVSLSDLQAQERVDLLLHNGKIFTADDLLSIQEVVAIEGDRIVAVGGPELLDEYEGEETIDLNGRLVVPGFNDVHIHISGDPEWFIDLTEVESIREIQELVREKAAELGPGEWITGYGWSEDELAEQRRPLRWDLDEAAPDNPVILTRAGGHSAVSNSEALQRAGVDENTPQPEGGVIEREDDGRLNGIIRERQDLVGRLVPEAEPEDVRESFVANLQDLLSHGITSIVQAGAG
ncbi:MAG: amidohydrolase family protein, partial [Longimicrobiales bacterium]|nr:amidohydrolase family protein [Longimicrobiales bacterium]